jgi:hypothetical protein
VTIVRRQIKITFSKAVDIRCIRLDVLDIKCIIFYVMRIRP